MNKDIEINGNMNLGAYSPLELTEEELNEELEEKAVSKAQQRFFGMVRARQKGELDADEVSKSVNKAAKSMTKKDVKDFAATKHKGLPNHVDENTIAKLVHESVENLLVDNNPAMFDERLVNDIVICAENEERIYNMLAWLENALFKKVKKGLVPELDYLANCSTMKQICREAIKNYYEIQRRCDEPIPTISNNDKAEIRKRLAGTVLDGVNWKMDNMQKEELNEEVVVDFSRSYDMDGKIVLGHYSDGRWFVYNKVNGKSEYFQSKEEAEIYTEQLHKEVSNDDFLKKQQFNKEVSMDEGKLRKLVKETVQQHLVDVMAKYVKGEASSEEANKAIMDLANSSNGKTELDERNNRSFPEYAEEYMKKNGEKLPDEILKNAAKKNDERFFNRKERDGKYIYTPQSNEYEKGLQKQWSKPKSLTL